MNLKKATSIWVLGTSSMMSFHANVVASPIYEAVTGAFVRARGSGEQSITESSPKTSASRLFASIAGRPDLVVGSAFADLSTGKLGAAAQSVASLRSECAFVGPKACAWENNAYAYASLQDFITVSGPYEGLTEVNARVYMHFHGATSSSNTPSEGDSYIYSPLGRWHAAINIGGHTGDLRGSVTVDNAGTPAFALICNPNPCSNVVGDEIFETIEIGIPVSKLMPSFYIGASLLVEAADGMFANFSNTATLGIILPDGFSFSSASGAFLTNTNQVPEPSSCALLASGLLAALLTSRRKAPVSRTAIQLRS